MDKNTKKSFLIKTYTKYISTRYVLGLINFNQKSSLLKSYWNSFYCSQSLVFDDESNTLNTKYCKNRWCITCNRIRTAQLIHSYGYELEAMEDPYFITLTAPTVSSNKLRSRIKEFETEWRGIMRQVRNEKTAKNPIFREFRGIRKMECTLRPNDHYHYHYHIIIDGKKQGEWILNQWLKRIPNTSRKAQDIRKADQGSWKELFKYFTKLLSKDDGLFKDDKSMKKRAFSEFKRNDFLFRTLKGKRVFQPFGGIKKASEEITDELIQKLERPDEFLGKFWQWQETHWLSELEEVLCDYMPTKATQILLRYTPKSKDEVPKYERMDTNKMPTK